MNMATPTNRRKQSKWSRKKSTSSQSKYSLIVLVLMNEISYCYVLLFYGYNGVPRRQLHWSADGDVRNKAITSGMARLQGTELCHGITGQKR